MGRKSSVNVNDFEECKSKYHAYILGLLWADGYVRRYKNSYSIIVGLVSEDLNVIKNVFEKTAKWIKYIENPKNKKQVTRMIIGNKDFYNFLLKNDYIIKSKCSANKILSIIPEKFKPYWWRGYFDGDGCISGSDRHSILSFCGSYEQDWSFIFNLFKFMNSNCSIIRNIKKNSKSSCIRCSNKRDIIKWREFIYPNGYDFGFKRKYNKLFQIKYTTKAGYNLDNSSSNSSFIALH